MISFVKTPIIHKCIDRLYFLKDCMFVIFINNCSFVFVFLNIAVRSLNVFIYVDKTELIFQSVILYLIFCLHCVFSHIIIELLKTFRKDRMRLTGENR